MIELCYQCDGDGFSASGGNCTRCGGGGKEPTSYPSERVMVAYRLPGGRIVQVDDSAAKGALVIGFELERGKQVQAVRVGDRLEGE